MEPPALPRFELTQRREFLKRAAAVAGLALIPGLAGCSSKDDKSTFAAASTTTAAGAVTSTTATPSDGATTSTTGSTSTGDPLPDGAALDVAFTFAAAGGGGPARNPFVAAWIETEDGDLIANISVLYNPPKGNRWINNLASWFTAVSSTSSDYLETTTGATQPAGAYAFSWDGTDVDGARASQGSYVVYVESAQEHGNHSLTSAPITLGASAVKASLPDDGDLSGATASYTA